MESAYGNCRREAIRRASGSGRWHDAGNGRVTAIRRAGRDALPRSAVPVEGRSPGADRPVQLPQIEGLRGALDIAAIEEIDAAVAGKAGTTITADAPAL